MRDAHGSPSPDTRLRLLGRPSVAWQGREEPLVNELPQRLLVYLAVSRGWVAREQVAEMLWPDLDPGRRLANLRRVLGRARAFPWAADVEADKGRLRWLVGSDVAAFDDAGLGLDERLSLWRGRLFEGVHINEDDPFGHWLSEERRRLEARWRALVMQRAEELAHEARSEEAAALLGSLLEHDALDEEALQRLMRSSARAGRVAQGWTAYRRFALALDRELGLEPLESTRRLAEELDDLARETQRAGEAAAGVGDAAAGAADGGASDLSLADDTRPYLDPPLIGRDQAVARLRRSDAAMLLLTGEAGVGKTRLVRAVMAGGPGLWMRGMPAQKAVPFGAVTSALRAALVAPMAKARVEALPRPLREAMQELLDESPARPSRWDAGESVSAERRSRLVGAASAGLRAAAGGIVVVDDMHDLDGASLEVVLHLARTVDEAGTAGAGPRVLATARALELAASPEATQAVMELRSEGRLQLEEVGALAEAEVAAFVEAMSGRPGGSLFARRLHAATGGNPLYLLETIRSLFDAGLLSLDAAGGWSTSLDEQTEEYAELPIPASVREAVVGRVLRLGDATRRVLEAASLAVAPFTLEQVAPATALSAWLALEGLERAVQAGLVLPEAGAGAYRFAHELLRRSVADALGSERRELIERRLAWSLERQRGSPALIAAHFERAGRRADALRWHRRAAEDAARLFVPSIALEHLERAAELAEHDGDRAEIALQRATLLDDTSDVRGRELALEEAAAAALRLDAPDLLVRVALQRAEFAGERGALAEAAAEVEKALAAGAHGEQAAQAHHIEARLRLAAGEYDAAEAALARASAELPPGPSVLRGLLYLGGYCRIAYMRGEMTAALEHLATAEEAFEATGRRDKMVDALNMRGALLMIVGDRAGAIDRLEAGLALAREMGLVHLQRGAILNLVKLHVDVLDVAAAAPLIDEGLALAHDFDTPAVEAAFMQAVGYVRYLQGELEAARRAWERSQQVADETGELSARLSARLVPFYPYLNMAELARCRLLLREARELAEASGRALLAPRMAIYAARLALAEDAPDRALEALAPLIHDGNLAAEERGELSLAHAMAQAALGNDAAALEALHGCEAAPTFEVALRALALRLAVCVRSGRPWREAAAEVDARLSEDRLPPFEGIDLMLAMADAHEADGEVGAAEAMRAEAAARRDLLLQGPHTPVKRMVPGSAR